MRHRRRPVILLVVGVVATLLSPAAPAAAADDPVIVAAGDIGNCATTGDEATSVLLDGIPGTVAALGDIAYPNGTAANFRDCYAPTWGRHRSRTRPAVGNHEYKATSAATPYFDYFGSSAGPRGKGWYSYDLGAWHVVVLNSNCAFVGGCGPSSAQVTWLKADLSANAGDHVLAYFHHPRYSSGLHGNEGGVQTLWEVLYAAGAELVLNGHDHSYERFAPQDPWGRADTTFGIREFVVGTGGTALRPKSRNVANSEVFSASHGVLKLTLRADGYDWAFVPIAGKSFTDAGTGTTHGQPPPRPAAPSPQPVTRGSTRHIPPRTTGTQRPPHRRQHRRRQGRPRLRQGQGQRYDRDHRPGRSAPLGDQRDPGRADGRPDDDELEVERHDVGDPSAGDGAVRVGSGRRRGRRLGRGRRDGAGHANRNLRVRASANLERRASRVVEPGAHPPYLVVDTLPAP